MLKNLVLKLIYETLVLKNLTKYFSTNFFKRVFKY